MASFTISDFFSKQFEKESTNILLNNKHYFSESAVEDYVNQMTNYSLQDYIHYLVEHPISDEITSRDITQLSSIEDCTINFCSVVKEIGNPGMSLIEIATALHADNNYKDNTVALTKYGENHAKTALQLGLAIYKNELWYLTAIGYVFGNLNARVQNKYLSLIQLRDPFYSRVIISLISHDTNLKEFMTVLSESTQTRRASSCLKVLSFFIDQCSIEGVSLNKILK
ncbi:MAG: hypothetical protein BWX72_00249 [Firmicutes bacterium ADurb.Bin080]|jgi:hypothetical protein|nr:MAG: hypothetical protein BWX72_00249 [Firmicutes bacterium ADurb.Bin080]